MKPYLFLFLIGLASCKKVYLDTRSEKVKVFAEAGMVNITQHEKTLTITLIGDAVTNYERTAKVELTLTDKNRLQKVLFYTVINLPANQKMKTIYLGTEGLLDTFRLVSFERYYI